MNEGGVSFPSEVLSVGYQSVSEGVVLVVNSFDRVSPPFSFQSKHSLYAGFYNS